MEITINNQTIKLKKTFKSYILFESATGKPFAPNTLTDSILFFYCVLIASGSEIELTFDEFLNWLDDNEKALTDFTEWLIKQSEIEGKLTKKKSSRTQKKA